MVAFNQTGWIEAPAEVERQMAFLPMPLYGDVGPKFEDGKEVLLFDLFRQATDIDIMSGPQEIGDCVSWGWGGADDIIQAIQILQQRAEGRQLQEFQTTATESIYGFSRVEIGGQRGSRSDGSTGIWAARAVSTKGTLSRAYLKSKGLDPKYTGARAKLWGANGVPDDLEPEAAQRKIQTVTMVTNFEQAAAAIQNGYPVPVCSNVGFNMKRDSEGFVTQNPRDPWPHCMLFCGVRFGSRPGLALANSWGLKSWIGAPSNYNEPRNVVWIDVAPANKMLAAKDSYAASQHMGFPIQDMATWAF